MTTLDDHGIDPAETLADLVSARPGTAAALDRLRLDYCCGGDRPLRDAVAEAGLDLAEVVEALSQPGPTADVDWAQLDPAALVDHLEATHHVFLRDALPRLLALADKVAGVHGERHHELLHVRALVAELRADLDPHLRKEEEILFPMVRQLARASEAPRFHCGSLQNPITVMEHEHDRAGELLAAIHDATGGYEVPDDGCASYRALYEGLAELEADTHLHVHKENNVLFPAVVELERRLAGSGA